MHSASTAHRARHFGHYLAHAFEKLHHIKHDSDEHSKSSAHSNKHHSKLERSISDHSQARMRSVLLRQISSENNMKLMDKAPMKRLSSSDSITSGIEIATNLGQPHIRLRVSDDNISMAQ